MTPKNRTLPRKKGGASLTGRAALFYTYSALEKHSCRALRQNGGYRDRQKTDLIFTRTAGSRIFVRSPSLIFYLTKQQTSPRRITQWQSTVGSIRSP